MSENYCGYLNFSFLPEVKKNQFKNKKEMENKIQANEPNKKTTKDFIMLFVVIGGLIAALILLKYAMNAFHLM